MKELAAAAEQICLKLLGVSRARAEIPPPAPYKRRQQSSVRVDIGGKTVIVTHRRRSRLARLEISALKTLHGAGAAVPGLLAWDGNWLIQEDAGRRLPQVLQTADRDQAEALIDAALGAVVGCQVAGQAGALSDDKNIRLCGHQKMLRAVPRVCKAFHLPVPDMSGWREILERRTSLHRFLKWDTRLGNAVVNKCGDIIWIDWEECGIGDPARDLVKILCDDWISDRPEMEARLMEKHLVPLFHGLETALADVIMALYGTLISVIRIEQILLLKGDGPWWRPAACLDHDLIAVTPEAARLHCRRGARWARRSPLSADFAPCLEEMSRTEMFRD